MIKFISMAIVASALALGGCTEGAKDAPINNEQNSDGGLTSGGTGNGTTDGTSGSGTTGTGTTVGLTSGGSTGTTTSETSAGTSTGTTSSDTTGGGNNSLANQISNGSSLSQLTDYWSCSFDVTATETIIYSIAFAADRTGTYSDDLNEGLSVSWSANSSVVSFILGANSPAYEYRDLSFNAENSQFTSDFHADDDYTATHVCERTPFGNNDGATVTAAQFINSSEDLWGCENALHSSAFYLLDDGRGGYIDTSDRESVFVNSWAVNGVDLIMNLADSSNAVFEGNRFTNANTFTVANANRGSNEFGIYSCIRYNSDGEPINSAVRSGSSTTNSLVVQLLNRVDN